MSERDEFYYIRRDEMRSDARDAELYELIEAMRSARREDYDNDEDFEAEEEEYYD